MRASQGRLHDLPRGVPLLVGVGAGLLACVLPWLAVGLGRNVPQQFMATDYSIGLIWAVVLGSTFLLWPISAKERAALLGLWLARCLITLGAMLWYEDRYAFLDAYGYFDEGRRSGFIGSELGFTNGTTNLIQLSALHDAILPGSYHAQKVTFSFVGLVAAYLLYRAILVLRPLPDLRILVAIGLFPSILFWSSILGKEPIVVLGTSMYVLGVAGWYARREGKYLMILSVGIGLAMFIRLWNGPILLLPLLVLILTSVRQKGRRAVLFGLGMTAMWIAYRQLSYMLQLETLEDALATADFLSQSWAIGGSAQRLDVDLTDPLAFAAFLPRGVFTALFRPIPGEILNPFGLLAGLENLLLLFLLGFAIKRARIVDFRHPLVLWAGVLVLVWAGAYAVVSYQNLGTAARFKVQILPILIGLLTYLSKPRWLAAKSSSRDARELS
jgi:hypothetical protein